MIGELNLFETWHTRRKQAAKMRTLERSCAMCLCVDAQKRLNKKVCKNLRSIASRCIHAGSLSSGQLPDLAAGKTKSMI